MTGPEHYREAERLVTLAQNEVPDDEPAQAALNARAQVHATLALAAAVGLAIRGADTVAWEATAGPRAAEPMPTALDLVDGRHG